MASLESSEERAIGGLRLETRAQVTLSTGCPLLMGLALVQLARVTRVLTPFICALSQPISSWQPAVFEWRGRKGRIPSLGRAISMWHRPRCLTQVHKLLSDLAPFFLAVSSSLSQAPKSVSYDHWHFWEWTLLFCIPEALLSTWLNCSHVCIFKLQGIETK